jgi:hypothetical protein
LYSSLSLVSFVCQVAVDPPVSELHAQLRGRLASSFRKTAGLARSEEAR